MTAINKEIKTNDSLVLDGEEVQKEYNVTLDMGENYEEIQESLLRNCPSMQTIMTSQNEESDVSISDKEEAKDLYDQGMESYRAQKFDQAIVHFKKATKKDRKFAWAWDMLGISYRKKEEFKKAIKAYDKSIALDPEGRMPLMNRPIANLMLENYDEAIRDYKRFIKIYPDDPEGFYGIGRVYAIQGNYEEALDNTMKAYLMYNDIDSPYARDAEKNLALYYQTLQQENKLDIWNKIADKYNIKIGG